MLGACSPTPEGLLVANAYGYAPTGNSGMAVAYFTLHNHTDNVAQLAGVHSALFANAEMHETVLHEGHARMQALPLVRVQPGEKLELRPGAVHLMLMQPREAITVGTIDTLTLQFSGHDAVTAQIRFLARNESPPMNGEAH